MKHTVIFLATFLFSSVAAAESPVKSGAFHIGVNLGELPWGGSFKPGLMVGYHFNDLIYVGATYQLSDSIRRDGNSFNAKGLGREGIVSSRESVASRFLIHARVRPHRFSPFLSLGIVGNGRDSETTVFDDGVEITQSRPGAVRPSLGTGYSYTFNFGLELSTEWSGWLFEKPKPEFEFRGTPLSQSERTELVAAATNSFRRQLTNKYHLFMLSGGYSFR